MIEMNTIPEKNDTGDRGYYDAGKMKLIITFANIQDTMNTTSIIRIDLEEKEDSVISSAPIIVEEG